MTSNQFDLAATAFAAASYFGKWGSTSRISASLVGGLQSFAIVNCLDRALRSTLGKEVKKRESSCKKGIFNAFAVEGGYSGILLTQNAVMLPFRALAALVTGMTAARTFVDKTKRRDTRAGLIWAAARETVLWILPGSYSLPLLIAADSVIHGFIEVCPSKEDPGPPRGSKPWVYKILTSAFFRTVANTAALATGISAAITQHVLFNVSRALPCEQLEVQRPALQASAQAH